MVRHAPLPIEAPHDDLSVEIERLRARVARRFSDLSVSTTSGLIDQVSLFTFRESQGQVDPIELVSHVDVYIDAG